MVENIIWNVKRDLGLCISFPTTGEPRNKYIEQNRQEYIRVGNLQRENGWLPSDPVGWWRFKKKGSSEPVPPPPDVWIVRKPV